MRISPVWEHFDLISPNKVRCSKELGYNNNTSSMLRHYRALHESKEDTRALSRQVKDTQPFSIVEDVGFRAFVSKRDPNYVLPTRQALKAMVEAKYESAKEKAKAKVEKAKARKLVGFFRSSTTAKSNKSYRIYKATDLRVCYHYKGKQSREDIPPRLLPLDVTGVANWRRLDTSVMEAKRSQYVTAHATVEVQRYLSEPNIGRLENPLEYWERQKLLYTNLHLLF
ncbi:zinc finger BED domain-containing protein 4-like [Solea senegalensis]|uniref:Zinc finger BED domain-containing protein 4-like n=1 Tax=Solea senegalensis TaxID=28829 RepID=A0AAV6PMG8_SOLSE|nr:zinc finger BED domain-containing protein 4-like [Solea senegalensis]